MRKHYILIVGLVLLSMVFAACTTPTTAPTTAPTTGPVVQPTTAPTTSGPVVQPTTAPTEEPTEAVAPNPYIGSGKLDGNGVPPDFFDDVHIRKAFSYCFDWDTVINDIYQGEAVQSLTLSLPGMPGYDLNAPHYTFDLAKCEEEFKLADVNHNGVPAGDDTGDVWDLGFRLQMLYNTGNTLRQTLAEILASDLSQVNDKFLIETLGLPWPSYLSAQRAFRIPIMTGGWLEDIHDPHNWYQPYTTGAYGARQGMPADLRAQFKALLDQGVSLTDFDARAAVYKQFNQLYYDQVPGVPVVLATTHGYEQKWVEGVVRNPIFPGFFFPTISKTSAAKDPTTFNYYTIGDAVELDPALAYDTASGEVIQNVYDTLVFYDGENTNKFVPKLAESYTISDDGLTYVFKLRSGVTFHNGDALAASDVAYTFQRGLLQGGYASPQWLLSEPFLGVGNDDITMIVDQGASADDREALLKNDPAVLKSACEKVQSAIVADNATNTVTMTLAQPWGPFLATIAQDWGSIMEQAWVVDNGGWDGTCDTWANYYGMTDAEDPFNAIANGTGPFMLDHWTKGQEIVMTKNPNYWGDPAKLDRVVINIVPEFGTRFAALQAGDADIIDVDVASRVQVDPLVGEIRVYDPTTNLYGPVQNVCAVDTQKLALDRFTICDTPNDKPLRLYYGRPQISQDVILYNFNIQ
jgi:ABC-type transport system substrate-binding protein